MPLRPIVSSIGSVTYETSKRTFQNLEAPSGKISSSCAEQSRIPKQLGDIKLGPDDIIMSYDVKALFTSVPIRPALKITQKLLEEDQTLPQRTTMDSETTSPVYWSFV